MTTHIIPVLMGSCGMGLMLECARRSARLRRLLSRNVVASTGAAVAAVGLALLAIVPISRYFSDSGRLWCGTYVFRSENWPAACEAWNLYAQRFDVARWPLLFGAALVIGANVWPAVHRFLHPPGPV